MTQKKKYLVKRQFVIHRVNFALLLDAFKLRPSETFLYIFCAYLCVILISFYSTKLIIQHFMLCELFTD